MPEEVIRQVFFNTAEEFLVSVEREWQTNPKIASDHNANDGSVREDLIALFSNDLNIVGFKQNIWRMRGLIQISRSIGDAYPKRFDFNRSPLPAKFIQSEPFTKPILKAEPITFRLFHNNLMITNSN
ncbi:putative protein phosphatase 2C family [Helianthus annuus]|nr:putative protein phosphatase 2C family [Helianthus annuus]